MNDVSIIIVSLSAYMRVETVVVMMTTGHLRICRSIFYSDLKDVSSHRTLSMIASEFIFNHP